MATKGVSVVVLVPTPWIPKAIGITKAGKSIRGIPDEYRFDDADGQYAVLRPGIERIRMEGTTGMNRSRAWERWKERRRVSGRAWNPAVGPS